MPINHNQTWDSEGNLINEEWIEIPEPELTTLDHLSLEELAEILRRRLENNA